MVCFQAEDPNITPIGVFCVAKKSNRVRLIFDTRTATPTSRTHQPPRCPAPPPSPIRRRQEAA
eukprot:6107751-Pyramimonas_sp.AAC.1